MPRKVFIVPFLLEKPARFPIALRCTVVILGIRIPLASAITSTHRDGVRWVTGIIDRNVLSNRREGQQAGHKREDCAFHVLHFSKSRFTVHGQQCEIDITSHLFYGMGAWVCNWKKQSATLRNWLAVSSPGTLYSTSVINHCLLFKSSTISMISSTV